jgi:hypothetical protein
MDDLNRRCLQLEDAELGPDAEDPIHRSVTELHRMRMVLGGSAFLWGRLSPQMDRSDRADFFAERGDLSTTQI